MSVPALQDSDGTWHAGALAAAVDNMCSAVVFTVVGAPTATVHYGLSYFSPVACNVCAFPMIILYHDD